MKNISLEYKILTLWALAMAAMLAICACLCDGNIIYTLDDPYIHLSLAETILHGGYGVNVGEYSAPSSSILWPLMLAITEKMQFGLLGPLFWNLIATACCILVGVRLLQREGLLRLYPKPIFSYALLLIFVLAISALALPMVGMEHTWHTLTALLALDGLLRAARAEKPSLTFYLAIIAMPLLRLEGMAYALLCLLALFIYGYKRQAIITGTIIAAAIGTHFAVMHALNLPLIASSILLKSRVMRYTYEAREPFSAIWGIVKNNLSNFVGWWQLAAIVAMGVLIYLNRQNRRIKIFLATVWLAMLAHLFGGQYGWFYRYEVYINTLAILGLLVGMKQALPHLSPRWQQVAATTLLLFCLAITSQYVMATCLTPLASRNIYEQQYQMRRFVMQDYQLPIAVNDLGLVSYGNDQYVLDLWGLGSEPVRKMVSSKTFTPAAMESLAADHQVGLVMIYENWFKALPDSWQKVAILHTSKVSAAEGEVLFLVTPQGDRAMITDKLRAFAATLPPQDQLEILN